MIEPGHVVAGFGVLFADDALLVIDKPSGLVVHPGSSADRLEDTIVGRLRAARVGAVHTVHRLDRGTSGVLVIARDVEVARALGAGFAEGAVQKRYVALVRGLAPEEAEVDHAIPSREGGPRVAATSSLRRLGHAVLADSPLRETRYSWVEVRPHTGRFHQVRRHTKHLGHPVIGDAVYGKGEHNRLLAERVGLGRLALHAAALGLVHPVTGATLSLAAPLPEDLGGPLVALGLPRACLD